MGKNWRLRDIGAQRLDNGRWVFHLWAPFLNSVDLRIVAPGKRLHPLRKGKDGYWQAEIKDVSPETHYYYRLDTAEDRPDPASHWQPGGVHGPSGIVDHSRFQWEDGGWPGMPLDEMIMYEIHTGTFTREGTLDAVAGRLDDLQELGVNTLSLMPLAQFPGVRNWGYDTAHPFAVQNSYGGPYGLKKLVNACHKRGIAVVLDVVYNHLGPEGNYLGEFAPYFTDRYKTPWGLAVNFDQEFADEVRNYFIQNAVHWFGNYHIDALRLDAVHAIFDMSAKPFLMHLAEEVDAFSQAMGKKFDLIAESDLNDVRILKSWKEGGMGLDAQWCDDFHHALHAVLTGEEAGYYRDFGGTGHLAKAFKDGYVIDWKYSSYRKRHHGSSSRDRPVRQFVVFSQNHDQVGNRMKGERLSGLIPFEALKLAAGTVILSPYIPLLFMGEEYGEEAPFLYFVDHSDPDLIDAVRRGRQEEFSRFGWREALPDPQSTETFEQSKLEWENREKGKHAILKAYYRCLIRLRKEIPAFSHGKERNRQIVDTPEEKILIFHRSWEESKILVAMNFDIRKRTLWFDPPSGRWKKIADSSDSIWRGPGSLLPGCLDEGREIALRPTSLSIYQKEVPA